MTQQTDARKGFDPRLMAAMAAAKLTGFGIRRLGKGGGTAAPGLVAERIDDALLSKLTERLPQGAVIVAGTNGKTTTTRMIADMFEAMPWAVVHNRSGSNLVRGVVAAFVQHARLTGHPGGEVGVIEGDEAALPELIRRSRPRVILLNNLFRDQLDRYGELDAVVRLWRSELQKLNPSTTVIVNADDPVLVGLTEDIDARCVYFGLDERQHRLDALPHAADAATCRNCGAELAYHALYVSHLGDWYCPNCGRARPELDYVARDIELHGGDSLTLAIEEREEGEHHLDVGVPGLYNAYNALAAVAVGREIGVPWETVSQALGDFRAAFGRIERITIKGRQVTMALVKNPTGFNEVLRMLTAETGQLEHPTLIAINDRDADGRDVSWLWDVDFESLASGTGALSTTGLRGADMANRLKYAGVATDRIHVLSDDLTAALDAFIDDLPDESHAYLLTSYTAMLALRKTLADRGIVDAFWEQ